MKILLEEARRNSSRPHPFSAAALSLLHDIAEQYVALVAEFLDVDVGRRPDFLTYWTAVAAAEVDFSLPYREACARMSRSRVNWKHHGVRPADESVQEALLTVESLLADTVFELFGVALVDISVGECVPTESVRKQVVAAERLWSSGDRDEALARLALSFDEAVLTAGLRSGGAFTPASRSVAPLMRRRGTTSLAAELRQRSRTVEHRLYGPAVDLLYGLASSVDGALAEVERAVGLLSGGLGGLDLARFQTIVPDIRRTSNSSVEYALRRSGESVSDDEFAFARNFVVEQSLTLAAADDVPAPNIAAERRAVTLNRMDIEPE